MGLGQAVTGWLAIGVGCRRGCPAEAIASLVTQARAGLGKTGDARLFTIADKHDEPGLRDAARLLGLDLVFLPREVLAAAMGGVATPSAAAQARFGVASVSEAAALAGAGRGARLLLARVAAGGATCAIAGGAEQPA